MSQTHDEFGVYLQKLRTKRGMTAQAVSRAVGKSDTYIGGWERYNRTVNMDILSVVVQKLGLTPSERQQLMKLAFNRNHPDVWSELTDDAQIAASNVANALAYVEHGPIDEDVLDGVSDATVPACFLLALYAISGFTEYGVDAIKWPEWVYKNKIVKRKESAHPIPKGLLSTVALPSSLEKRFVNSTLGTSINGRAMAGVYRLWLFSDLDRSMTLASAMSRYSMDWDPLLQTRLTFDFADGRADRLLNAQGVSAKVISRTCERLLIDRVWSSCSAMSESDNLRVFPHPLDSVDVMAVHAAFLAREFLDRAQWEQPVSAYVQQIIHDAAFSLRLMPKGKHLVIVAMYDMYLQLADAPRRNIDKMDALGDVYDEAESEMANMLKLVLSAKTLMKTETRSDSTVSNEQTTKTTKRAKGKAKKKRKS